MNNDNVERYALDFRVTRSKKCLTKKDLILWKKIIGILD